MTAQQDTRTTKPLEKTLTAYGELAGGLSARENAALTFLGMGKAMYHIKTQKTNQLTHGT